MKIGKNDFLFIPTLKLNLLRSFCTGIVFSIFFITNISGQNASFMVILLTPFFMPIMTLIFWVVYWITTLFGLGGVGSVMLMFTTVPGDPLVYILFKIKPEWKLVEKFNIINLAGLIFVYENYIPIVENNKEIVNNSCPFEGTILAEKDGGFLGFTTTHLSPIFQINNDWKVVTPNGDIFGWIDRKGEIHKDNIMPGNEIDPDAMLRGKIVGQLHGNSFYVNNENIGKWMKN